MRTTRIVLTGIICAFVGLGAVASVEAHDRV